MSDPPVVEAYYSLRSCPRCTLEVLRGDAFAGEGGDVLIAGPRSGLILPAALQPRPAEPWGIPLAPGTELFTQLGPWQRTYCVRRRKRRGDQWQWLRQTIGVLLQRQQDGSARGLHGKTIGFLHPSARYPEAGRSSIVHALSAWLAVQGESRCCQAPHARLQIWTLDEPEPWLRLIESHDTEPCYAALDISRLWRREPA